MFLRIDFPHTNDLGVIAGGLGILIALSILGLLFYNLFLHPLAAIPGPKLRAASRLPYLWGLLTGRHHAIVKRLHDTYGSVVRVAPDKLSYASAEAWRDIYGHKKHGEPEMPKSDDWYVPDPNAPHIINCDRPTHSRFRRLLSHGFSDKALREQEPLIRTYVDLLIEGLHRNLEDGGKPINMVARFNWTTFDIIGDLTFGEPFGCLSSQELHPWIQVMFGAIKGITVLRVMQHIPGASKVLPAILSRLTPASSIKRRQDLIDFTKRRVDSRIAIEEARSDFMQGILDQPEEKSMSYKELLSNSSILIIAGSETTATLLSGAVYLLLRHPDKMEKLNAEIRTAFRTDQDITIPSTSRLPYLAACVEESLRLYPPVPVGLPRKVPRGGAVIEGRFIPGGTSVTVDQISANLSALNWVSPDSFIPERFTGDPAFAGDKKNAMQPFSTGPRNCIGKNLAYAEVKTILSRVLFNFDLTLDKSSEQWDRQRSYTIWEKPPLWVHLASRAKPLQSNGGAPGGLGAEESGGYTA